MRLGLRTAAWLIAALCVLAPSTPLAKRGPTVDARAKREAREHYDKALAHLNLGEFDPAIAEFKLSYTRAPFPVLLFNIAQAYRMKKNYIEARDFYQKYLDAWPAASNRSDVEESLAEMDRQIVDERERVEKARVEPPKVVELPTSLPDAASKPVPEPPVPKLAAVPPPPAVTPVVPAAATAPPLRATTFPDAPGRKPKWAGLIAGGVGLALLGAAIYSGVEAGNAAAEVAGLATQRGTWNDRYRSIEESGQNAAVAATTLYVVGSAAIATGVVLYLVGWHKDQLHPVSVGLLPGGAAAVAACHF